MSVCALDIVSNVGAIDDLTSTARLVMNLPVALLDAVFILWVFASLSATLRTLQFRNATGKLQLYRRFTNALATWVWVSVAWVAYEMYLKVSTAVSFCSYCKPTLWMSYSFQMQRSCDCSHACKSHDFIRHSNAGTQGLKGA